MLCKRVQWPVGQGSFSTATVWGIKNPLLDYVYDCGSDSSSTLRNNLECYSPVKEAIDALFVSHLHSDHVNGLETLLTRHTVNKVILPYISDFEAALLTAEALKDGSMTYNYRDFLESPVEWFLSRGATSVLMVMRSAISKDPGKDQETDFGMEIAAALDRQDVVRRSDDFDIASPEEDNSDLQLIDAGTDLITPLSRHHNWVLAPFVPPVPLAGFQKFIEACEAALNMALSPGNLRRRTLSIFSHPEVQKRLKEAYDCLSPQHNYVSLCLYSGPLPRTAGEVKINRKSYRGEKLGWMGTGDSPLKTEKVLEAFEERYKRFLPYIGTLMCPHHGSKNNLDKRLLRITTPKACFASHSTTNGHGHPSSDVVNAIRLSDMEFFHVTEAAGTKLVEEIRG